MVCYPPIRALMPIIPGARFPSLRPGCRLLPPCVTCCPATGINAIRKEDFDHHLLAGIDYPQNLWMEKEIKSVANVTRQDVSEFLKIAANIPLHPTYEEFPLAEANTALLELKERKIRGAKVLKIS